MPVVPPLYLNPETGKVEGWNILFLGQRGQGKTYLMTAAIEQRLTHDDGAIVVHDPKRTFREKPLCRGEEWECCETFAQVTKSQARAICYSPSNAEVKDRATRNDFFEWVHLRGNTTLCLDEGTRACSDVDVPPYLEVNYATGRESGNEIWVATQQPVELPSLIYTQTSVFYVFYCALIGHRAKITGFVPIRPEQIAALKKTQLYYYKDDETAALGPYTLEGDELVPVEMAA